jgi:hypothetical protein
MRALHKNAITAFEFAQQALGTHHTSLMPPPVVFVWKDNKFWVKNAAGLVKILFAKQQKGRCAHRPPAQRLSHG